MSKELAPVAQAIITSADLVTAWLSDLKADGASPKTLEAYRKGLTVFEDWRRGAATLVTPADVLQFKGWLAEHYSIQTANLRLAAIRSFYRWAVTTGKLPMSPAESVRGVKRPKSLQHKRDPLTNGEVRNVVATCASGTPADLRDGAILSLMAYCGLRTVEVIRANVGSLKTQEDRLVLEVIGKGHVEADALAVIPRNQEATIRAWVAYRLTLKEHGDSAPLFVSLSYRDKGARLSDSAIRRMVKERFALAGVAGGDRRKTTHSLRHSAITKAIRSGASPLRVQTFARHTSFDTTLGYIAEESRLADPVEDYIVYDVGESNGAK